ncbi:MAG: hypothetical protein ACFFGZ_04035 [Candidatus Thorarchaeota archaeon]
MPTAESLLADLKEDAFAWNYYQKLIKEPHVLGFLVWGSRATGFGAPKTDWDALVYVTEEYYNQLELQDTLWWIFDESISPKRLVIDFSPVSDAWFRQQIESPLDIDHSPYAEGITLYDETGKLEEWRRKLARYPVEEHENRLKNKFVQFLNAFGEARIDDARLSLDREKFLPNRQINLYRAVLASLHLWFALKKSWTPPLKWWSHHSLKLGMKEDEFRIFKEAIEDPSLENVRTLIEHLKQMILDQGYDFPNDYVKAFLETIHTKGRPKQIRHTYL